MAQPASRYDTKASGPLAAQPTNIKETSTIGPSSTTASGSTQQDVYETTTQFNPLAQQSLDALIRMLLQGNAPGYSTGQRESVYPMLQNLLQDYSKQNAFGDAQGLMALTLQKAMEQNMPAISRAIEGAGTSAGSMQALLAGNAARDASLAASALGAEQAKSYGNISSNLMQLLETISRPDTAIMGALVQALNVAKGGNTTRQARSSGTESKSSMSSGATTTSNKAISYSGDEDEENSSGFVSYISGSSFAPGTDATPAGESSTVLSRGPYGGSDGQRITDYLGL